MPDVVSIDFTDGVRIVTSRKTISLPVANFPSGNLAQKEARVNQFLQEQFEDLVALADLEPDDRVKQMPPSLLINERIEKRGGIDYLVTTWQWVSFHIFSVSPLKYTIRIDNPELGPITGEWW